MAKTTRFPWSLSLRRLKIPSFLFDAGIGNQGVTISNATSSNPLVLNLRSSKKQHRLRTSLRSSLRQANAVCRDDIELMQNDPHYAKGMIEMAHCGVSDPGLRFLVYLVSLALSLAALSILKLHKLLEWLIVDSDLPSMTASLNELRTKSALISEILRAAASRYTGCDSCACTIPPTITDPSFVFTTSKSHQRSPHSVISVSTLTAKAPRQSSTSAICFHDRKVTTAASEQCLLCRVRSMEWDLHATPRSRRHRCYSESTATAPSVKWPEPSRLNAGVCRPQVVCNTLDRSFSVEICPGQCSPLRAKSGLCIASDLNNNKSTWFCSLSAESVTPQQSHTQDNTPSSTLHFRRSPKLVACVPPTSISTVRTVQTAVKSSSTSKVTTDSRKCRNMASRATLLAVVEETEQELESLFATEETHPLNLAVVTSAMEGSFLFIPPSFTPVTRRDCGVDACCETQDAANSPLFNEDFEEADHSGADGLELDDEGVYFAFDLHNRDAIGLEEEENTDQEESDEEDNLMEPHLTRSMDACDDEGLSNLVALTNSISNDLLQLESGCQELIHRVHANRIELDRVNDSLSFVWRNKDECSGADATVAAPSMMEDSWNSGNSVFTDLYSPTCTSFISTDSCCTCNCHREERAEVGTNPSNLMASSDLISSPTLVQADSFKEEKFFHPAVSFEDDDTVAWCDNNRPPRCSSLLPTPTSLSLPPPLLTSHNIS